MDNGNFGDRPRDQSQQPPSGLSTPSEANRGMFGAGEGSNPGEGAVFMHNLEHAGVSCDVCNGDIKGFRYKCLECVDFDLCSTCERRGNHPGHVMMRIAFPEQTRGAIMRFMDPTAGRGFHDRFAGHGFPFDGPLHRQHRAERNGHGPRHTPGPRDSDGESGPENTCPYGMGKKGAKKWAKCMKKMAYQHRRSAEAYARSCAATATQAAAAAAGFGGSGTENAENGNTATGAPFDFTAAASQIQEFLNAFGIPIDVVELYDSLGNRGQPRQDSPGTSGTGTNQQQASQNENESNGNSAAAAETNNANAAAGNTENNGREAASVTESGAQSSHLATHLQHLHLTANNTETATPVDTHTSDQQQHVTMDLDPDSAGWTVINPEVVPNAPSGSNSIEGNSSASANSGQPEIGNTSGSFRQTQPVASAPSEPSTSGSTETGTNAVPPFTTGPRLYPVVNPPQLQQLLNGVSQAMNSVVRNIPIVTNPGGPGLPRFGETTGPSSFGIGGGQQQPRPEMDTRSTTTLNQLLAMGFSNHDGWLSRLVVAKNGDLEAVLNALFPVGGQ